MKSASELAEAFDVMLTYESGRRVAEYWAVRLDRSVDSADFALGLSALQAKLEHVMSAINAAELPDRARGLYREAASSLLPFVSVLHVNGLTVSNLTERKHQVDILHLAASQLPSDLVPDVNTLTVAALIDELAALVEEISSAEISPELKHLVTSQLGTLIMALTSYDVLGYRGVCRVFGAAAAELTRTVGDAAPASSPETRTLLQKTLAVTKKMGAAVVWVSAVVAAANGLITDGSALLGLEGAETETVIVPPE